jgi:hypothetical protein
MRKRFLLPVALTLAAFALVVPGLVAQTHVGVDTDTAQTLSNKTLDRTNTVQGFANLQLWAAVCNNATALSAWDLPTSSAAVATCSTGSNTQKAVLDFSSSTTSSAQYTLQAPQGYDVGVTTSLEILWYSASTTGSVVWQFATACAANNASATDDPAFNTAQTVTSTAPGSANQIQSATISPVTMTGCAAGYSLHVKLLRDPSNGSDTMATNPARMMMVRLKLPKE